MVVAVQRRGWIPDMFGYVGGFGVKCELEGNHLRILREWRVPGQSWRPRGPQTGSSC